MCAIQGFPNMERMLEGMHKIAVADMASEATVRKHIRDLYMRHAVVSTGAAVSSLSLSLPGEHRILLC